jgi:hypothetical protein
MFPGDQIDRQNSASSCQRLGELNAGLSSGATDEDPSGITTYSQGDAALG